MVRAEIPALPNPSTSNGSYVIEILGPVMQCHDQNGTDITITKPSEPDGPGDLVKAFARRYHTLKMWHETDTIVVEQSTSPKERLRLLFTPCPRGKIDDTTNTFEFGMPNDKILNYTFLGPVKRTRCTPAAAKYTIHVSFLNGIQRVEHSTNDHRPLVPVGTPEVMTPKSFNTKPLEHWQEWYNILAMVNSMTVHFTGSDFGVDYPDIIYDGGRPTPRMHRLDNGTEVEACPANWVSRIQLTDSTWQGMSALNLDDLLSHHSSHAD